MTAFTTKLLFRTRYNISNEEKAGPRLTIRLGGMCSLVQNPEPVANIPTTGSLSFV
jgi:hypothetical protein